jgi:hypothetical protein
VTRPRPLNSRCAGNRRQSPGMRDAAPPERALEPRPHNVVDGW